MDESFVRTAVDEAEIKALRMALYQATGDPELAAMQPVFVEAPGGAGLQATMAEGDQTRLKELAVQFLMSGAATDIRPEVPDRTEIDRLITLLEGRPLTEDYLGIRRGLLSFGEFPRQVEWTDKRPQIPEDFEVVVVGAGFSGVVAGVHLTRLGIPYRILERRHEVGGVWSINTYPDARVDTLSSTYQYSFEKNYPWSEHFACQPEVRGYIEHVAKKYGVFDRIEFDRDVIAGDFDEATSTWVLTVTDDELHETTLRASVVISASGLFATPKELDVEGVGDFQGEILHTTQWSSERTVEGKRVAIIGNGSTGVQLLSQVAEDADQVYVMQRTPQWISPRPHYGEPVSPESRWLLDTMPYYSNWSRYTAIMPLFNTHELLIPDEDWIGQGGMVNARNDAIREFLISYIKAKVGDRTDLIDQLIPDYAPITRRPVVDNNWYTALTRENVELVSTPIERITKNHIVTVDGKEREVDMIIAAVGFQTSKYLWPAEYRGVAGISLEDVWGEDGARAYLGITMPGFPNFFMVYGPNSQPLSGGVSLPTWFEVWALYALQAIILMLERGCSRIEVRKDVYDEYNQELDRAAGELILMKDENSRHKNYYINEWGRMQVNAPWETDHYFAMCSQLSVEDYSLS